MKIFEPKMFFFVTKPLTSTVQRKLSLQVFQGWGTRLFSSSDSNNCVCH